jgi:vacuolar-type H+-ATPase subunit H
MDVLELIDELHDLVHSAKPVPLRDQLRVDKAKIYDMLDRRDRRSPKSSSRRAGSSNERQEMLAAAKHEAERIIKEARERQTQLVAQHERIRHAERAAEDIIEDARIRERDIRLGAKDYADELLATLEVNLAKLIAAAQRGRGRLHGPDDAAEVG